jgi:DNA modification methylase
VLFGIKPKGPRTFNADCAEGNIVERYAAADKVSSIVYKAVKDANSLDNLDAIFAKAKKEAEEMLKSRKRNDSGLVQCVIPNTITYSGGLGRNKIHPTQKPVPILEYFIELLSNEGDTVLDTFAGSGSTGVACYNLKRDCILIERDTGMFCKMQERINDLSTDQLDTELFEES